MPVYNSQAYLAQAIESCLNQTVKNIELIIVDDGSTDASARITDYYAAKDERIHAIHLEQNAGRSNARNLGMKAAKGEYIFVMDSDDISLEDRVQKTLEFFKKNPGVDIAYSRSNFIDGWGNLLKFKNNEGQESTIVDARPLNKERLKETLMTFIVHSSMAMKNKVAQTVEYSMGDYDKHAIDDWKFQIDCLKAGFTFAPIGRVLVQYREFFRKRDEAKIKELKEACL
jgi:glycosyltransferase involved in cell wall biosynthesis